MIKQKNKFKICCFFFGLLWFLMISCSNSKRKYFEQKEFYDNGNIKTYLFSQNKNTHLLDIQEYYRNGNIKSKGKINTSGLRESHWVYYNEDLSFKAKGNYSEGSKIDLWNYENNMTIRWDIYKNSIDSFKVNIPSEWVQKKLPESNLIVFYEDSVKTKFEKNFNILALSDNRSLHDISNESLAKSRVYYEVINVLDRKDTIINGSKSMITKLEINNGDLKLYAWQVLIGNTDKKINLNFFSLMKNEQIFDEVIYSVFIL